MTDNQFNEITEMLKLVDRNNYKVRAMVEQIRQLVVLLAYAVLEKEKINE